MDILTYPIGLVIGLLPVVTNPGPGGPATIMLDGRPACRVTVEAPECTVDLGAELRVHLLELVRTDARGRVTERATRWVNRPGAQAEAYLRGSCDEQSRTCELRVGWGHPAKLEPRSVVITANGVVVSRDVVNTLTVPMPAPPEILIAGVDVAFPDGKRVSRAIAVGQGESASAGAALTPVPLLAAADTWPTELAVPSIGSRAVRAVENAPSEVVFVIEPGALRLARAIQDHAEVHDSLGTAKAPEGTTRTSSGSIPEIAPVLDDVAQMSVLLADGKLRCLVVHPRPGAAADDTWLDLLGQVSSPDAAGPLRLADAVAVAGQMAAGGPRRRAVVLVLSDKHRDESAFTPAQAQAYLGEIMVPLVVWRAGKAQADGWPEGVRVGTLTLGKAVRGLRTLLDRQRIAWIEGDVLATGPATGGRDSGWAIAGREGAPPVAAGAAGTAAAAAQAAAEETLARQGQASASVSVTAVRVAVRLAAADGTPVEDLEPGDLGVVEDGVAATVVSVERLTGAAAAAPTPEASPAPETTTPAAWQVAVYVAPELCSRDGLPRSIERVAAQIPHLLEMGPVSVALGADDALTLADRATDRRTVATALGSERIGRLGRDRIARIRREVDSQVTGPPALEGLHLVQTLQNAIREELGVVARELSKLQAWARQGESRGGKLLVLVMDGFDLDPAAYYLAVHGQPLLKDGLDSRVRAFQDTLSPGGLAPLVRDGAAALSRMGWTLVTIDSGASSVSLANAAERHSNQQISNFASAGFAPGSGEVLRPITGFVGRRDPLADLADDTGGEVLGPSGQLDTVLAELRGAWLVTYQVDRPADGRVHALEVTTARPGVTVKGPKTVLSGTSEDESRLRAVNLLAAPKERGDLPVTLLAILTPGAEADASTGSLRVTVDPASLREALVSFGVARFRVTLAVPLADLQPFVSHDVRELQVTEATGPWVYTAPLRVPIGTERLAVVVEELGTGAWGGAVAELPR